MRRRSAKHHGTYWTSPTVPIVQSLDNWKNQRVRFVFRVMQDGWGDRTQGQMINFSVATRSVPPLSPITETTALAFEAGNNIDTANFTAQTRLGVDCLRAAAAAAGASFALTSAFRPAAYQAHLREVRDTWKAVKNLTQIECATIKADVRAEFQRHSLLESQRPAAGNLNAPHSTGIAFDATIRGLPTGQTVDSLASGCSLHRPWPVNDPVHFQPL